LLRRHCPASTLVRPCPTPALAVACCELRPLRSHRTGLHRLPEPPSRRAAPTTSADRAGTRVDCFPAHAAFPKWQEGRHPHCHFRGLLKLHSRYRPPDRSAAHGDPCHEAPAPSGYPAEPLVSYQINRQFSGWLLPPQVIRAFRAHCQLRTCWREPSKIDALVYDDCISGTAANTVEISSRSSLLIRKLKGQRDLQQPGAVAGLTSDVIVIGV